MRTTSLRWLAATAALAVLASGCASREERAEAEGGAASEGASEGAWSAGTDTIKVGLIGPVTGPFAVLGVSQQNSLQVVADQINADGGIGGAQVELVVRDSGLDPAKAVQAANELAGDATVQYIVGPSISAFYNAASPVFEQNQKLNCQPAVAVSDFGALEYGFRSQDSIDDVTTRMLGYLEAEGITSLGLVYEGDDTGKAFDALLAEKTPEYGIEYVGYQATRPDDQSHRPYVDALADAQAIWVSNNVSGALTMAATAEAGYGGRLVGGSGMQNIAFVEAAGDQAIGATFAAPNYQFLIRDRETWQPGYREHIEAIEADYGINTGPKTGATSPQGTAIAGDCMYAFAAAANEAQSLEPGALVEAMQQLDIPAEETPSGNSIAPGDAHEFYDVEDIHVYQWQKDGEGWFIQDVTPQD